MDEQFAAAHERLPPELLQHILALLSYTDRVKAGGVCKKWREALLGDPRLWMRVAMREGGKLRPGLFDECARIGISRASPSLVYAELDCETLTARGLSGLSACTTMARLSVSSNLVSAEEIAACLPPKDVSKLDSVFIAGCNVDKTSLEVLRGALPEDCDLDMDACELCDNVCDSCVLCNACDELMCDQCNQLMCDCCEESWCEACVPDMGGHCEECGKYLCDGCLSAGGEAMLLMCECCERVMCSGCTRLRWAICDACSGLICSACQQSSAFVCEECGCWYCAPCQESDRACT